LFLLSLVRVDPETPPKKLYLRVYFVGSQTLGAQTLSVLSGV
jgi:hypothetical protein